LGRIVVVGGSGDFRVARYRSDGTLDTSFNGTGVVITDFSGHDDYCEAVALDASGHIVVAGRSGSSQSGGSDFALARYHPDGSLDTAFGDDGKVTTDLGASGDWAYAIALDPIGRILVAGSTYQSSTGQDFAVVRYLDGEPVRSYMPLIRRR
jgi:uncharacterized delta-60 repeat protein